MLIGPRVKRGHVEHLQFDHAIGDLLFRNNHVGKEVAASGEFALDLGGSIEGRTTLIAGAKIAAASHDSTGGALAPSASPLPSARPARQASAMRRIHRPAEPGTSLLRTSGGGQGGGGAMG